MVEWFRIPVQTLSVRKKLRCAIQNNQVEGGFLDLEGPLPSPSWQFHTFEIQMSPIFQNFEKFRNIIAKD